MMVRFFNVHFLKVAEHFLVLSISDSGDAKLITDVVLAQLTKTGLTSSKMLDEVGDSASAMAGAVDEFDVLQERENREIFYVHCLNYKIIIVVVHAFN